MKILNKKRTETYKAIRAQLKVLVGKSKLSTLELKTGFHYILDVLDRVNSGFPYSETDYDNMLKDVKQRIEDLVNA